MADTTYTVQKGDTLSELAAKFGTTVSNLVNLNGITNAVVLLSYPKNAFGQKQALRMFISTNVGLSTQEILDLYVKRWPIEVFFRNSKSKLAFDTYQIRSQKGSERYWQIMSLKH